MVLLLLALVWGALLVSWLRSRTATTFSDSVGSFRRNLNVLERATPAVVSPANRLRDSRRLGPSRLPATRPLGYRATRPGSPAALDRRPGRSRLSPPVAASSAALRRRQAQKRRRDVFFALSAGAAGSFALALIPGLGVMWVVQVLFDVLLGSYCAVLVRIRNAAAERELKLHYMPSGRAARAAGRLQPSYDFGAVGYGDLELRRAAN